MRHDITPERNVAVFQYCDENGRLLHVTVASANSQQKRVVYDVRDKSFNLVLSSRVRRSAANKHSEMALIKWLLTHGIPLASVRTGFTEREPCLTPGRMCDVKLATQLPHVPMGFSRHYVEVSPETEEREKNEQKADDKELKAQWSASKSLFRAAPQGSATGALLETVNLPASPSSGGIDFSSLELRYLADKGSADQEGLRYAFRVRPTADGQASVGGLPYAQQASDAFFVWLALPPSSFTVNLNPDEPDRIVDAQLGRTDAGRVLLEADLQLKKTTAALIHPNTELGAQFWKSLRGTCATSRMWITPGVVRVRETQDELYILDAPLSVRTEAEHLGRAAAGGCLQGEATQRDNEQLFRSLILPKIEQAVNNAPEYQNLRRVYLSRVAAQWIRDRSAKETTAYSDIIDKGEIGPWVRYYWEPREIYDRYVKSFTEGEFHLISKTPNNLIQSRTYFYGGVDFTRAPRFQVSDALFQEQRAHLPATIDNSVLRVTPDVDGQHLWLGGGVGRASDSESVSGSGPGLLAIVVVALLGMILVTWLLVLLKWLLSRRRVRLAGG